ncbi:MAG: hypothetical protein AAF662_12280 [Pseudomonadota bacterium]
MSNNDPIRMALNYAMFLQRVFAFLTGTEPPNNAQVDKNKTERRPAK